MNLESATSKSLKISIAIGIAVTIIGEILNLVNYGTDVLYVGILLLILSPFIGVIVSTICLITEKDWKWVYTASILIVISVIGMMLSLFGII